MQLHKHFFTAFALVGLTASVWAQTQSASTPLTNTSTAPITAADIQALKDALAAQQKQIQALQEQLQQRNQALDKAQTTASDAAAKADAAQAQATQLKTDFATLRNVNDTQGNTILQPAVMTVQDPQQGPTDQAQTFNKQMEGPITIHFRGINITPGGYVEGAFVRRSRALGADLPTPFNNLTMPGASQSAVPEFFGSGRQSKVTGFVDGRMANVNLSAYVSADFLSAGVTSTSTQTNSYTLRLRQAWGQAKFQGGWSVLAGQNWSLVTENGAGISPDDDLGRTNDARPKTIDPSYNVGFVFARQYGLRLTKTFGDKIAFAVAIENPQATLTTHGNAANFLLGEAGASNSYNTTSTYSFNPSPDIIAKIAFDPGFGHYEIFGIYNRFKDRVFPCTDTYTNTTTTPPTVVVGPECPSTTLAGTAAAAFTTNKDSGGFGASARWNFFDKRFTVGLKGFGGSGVGRYGPGGLPDVSINGDGTLHLVKNLIGLSTLEWNASKRLTLVAYTGAEYASRAASFDPLGNSGAGAVVGYGSPGFKNSGCYTESSPSGTTGFSPGSLSSCTADTRAVVEGTFGFWYRLFSGPQGRFQFGTQYSYVNRATWSGKGGEPHGLDSMVFTSFRYYLP